MVLQAGGVDEAMRFERVWNELADSYQIDVLCGYLDATPGEEYQTALQQLCAQHTAIGDGQAPPGRIE